MKRTHPSGRMGVWVGLCSVALVSGGAWLTFWTAQQADGVMRNRLLAQASTVARQINTKAVAALTFEASDKAKPQFQRLRSQMAAYAREALPLFGGQTKYLGIYSIARRGNDFCFGPESIDEHDRRASSPGTPYQEPPAEVARVFDSHLPQTVGPYSDEYGTYVSAFAPVSDPRTGEVVLVIGLDIEAAEWRAEVARHCVEPLGFTLALGLVAAGGLWLVRRRGGQEGESRGWLGQHAGTFTVAMVGMLFSLLLARVAHQTEARRHQETFLRLADGQVRHLEDLIWDLRHSLLEGLGRFFEGSQTVERTEFLTYAGYLAQEPGVRAWEWIPVVPAEDRVRFEASVRASGPTNFGIWEKERDGRRTLANSRSHYYPVELVEPLVGNEVALGYDLGSEPIRRAALEEAARTGLITATAPVTLVQETDDQKGLLVFRPVFTTDPPKQLRGFALAVIRLGDLLQRVTGLEAIQQRSLAFLELRLLATNNSPVVLASTSPMKMRDDSVASDKGSISFTAPLFAFGQTYAMVARPTPAFAALYPARAGVLAGLAGLGLTALLAALVDVVSRRRSELEIQVRQRTVELRASEESYRHQLARATTLERFNTELVENATDIVYSVDLKGNCTSVNPAAERLLGYSRAELLGMNWAQIVASDHQALAQRQLEQKIAAGQRGSDEHTIYELEVVTKAGRHVWLEISTRLIRQAGEPVGIQGIGRDITERKQAQQALEASLLFLNQNEKIARIGGFKTNPKTDSLLWTEGIYRLIEIPLDYKPGLAEGLKFYAPEYRPLLHDAITRTLEDGTPFLVEAELITRLGKRLWVEVRGLARVEAGGEPAVVGTLQDISERKRAEEALRALSSRQEALLAAVPDIIAEVDANNVYTWMNRAGFDFFGDEALGKKAAFYFEGAQETDAAVEPLFSGDAAVFYFESRQRRHDGEKRLLAWWCRVLKDAKGNVTGALSTAHDITELKRAGEEKEKLQAQLTQAQKMESVGRLAGGVAHDFNNMLQAILGNTALALMDLPPESPLREHLEEIQKSAQRSADLTRQLLAFARKQTIAPKVLDLNEAVAGTLKMLRRLIGEDIELAWLPGADLGLVNVDPSQVDQILANLCVNARDAIGGSVGKVTIETHNAVFDKAYVTAHPEARAGEYVRLAVSDNGCGMSPEVQAHLFEPFFTTKGLGQGTGLGLATVYGIVKQNHGFITVCSEPDRGTTFEIYLPRHTVRTAGAVGETPVRAPDRGKETILLVEDEPTILRVSRRMLENLGYSVLAATTPGEAIRFAREHVGEIHLLVTDVVMPEMNGRELARNLLNQYPNLKRLFMSGYTADVIAHHGVLDPGVHFLQKPFSVQALADKVREALND